MPEPTLEELLAARIEIRKAARSGNPAKRAEALQRLLAVNQLIVKAKRANAKVIP